MIPDLDLEALEDFGPSPFDRPVPSDLMLELDLDEVDQAIGRFEAQPERLAPHAPRLAGLAARLAALADAAT